MRIFVLEDSPERHKKFRRELVGHHLDMVETVEEGRELIKEKYDLMFLDHDLGGEIFVPSGEGTGYEMAKLIAESVNKNSAIIIHSCNHAGSTAMGFHLLCAQRIPFVSLDIEAALVWAEEYKKHERI